MITDFDREKPTVPVVGSGVDSTKPASVTGQVITDSTENAEDKKSADPPPQPGRSPSSSACESYRDAIELGLSRGRNAKAIWQDLVDTYSLCAGYFRYERLARLRAA